MATMSETKRVRLGLPLTWRAMRARLWPESGAISPIPCLDGVRAVAVLLTMLFHAWWILPGVSSAPQQAVQYPINYGRTGVHLFFVLSGFLLFLPYARWLFQLQGRPSALNFYKRRILRVGPAYWCSLLLLTMAAPLSALAIKDLIVHAFFLSNLFPFSVYSINGVFWTMAIEVQFYVLLPLIGWIAYALTRRVGPASSTILVGGGLLAISLGSGLIERHVGSGHLASVSSFIVGEPSLPHWLDVFGDGIVCSVAYTYLTRVWRRDGRRERYLTIAGSAILGGGVALALIVTFVPRMHTLAINGVLFGWSYAAILFGLLFGAVLPRRLFESRILRFVGLISYSLYIWHIVIIELIEPHLAGLATSQQRVAVGFVLDVILSIPVAYLSYQLTERPFFAARKRAHEPAPVVAAP